MPEKRTRRFLVLCAAMALAAPLRAQEAAADPNAQPAEPALLAARSLLLDVARAGERLVAVGERGHVLVSEDGTSWKQAESVPTQAMLTGVCFADASRGIAVGHDEVILRTTDGGFNWQRVHFAPQAQQPLLDVLCLENGRVIAIGAYSTYFLSTDGGGSWARSKFEAKAASAPRAPAKPPAEDDYAYEDIPPEYHLNRIVAASPTRLYIAAEAGQIYRSDDAGASWVTLASPYEGSLFGALPLGADALLVFGLRGNLFRSEDGGGSWQRLESGTIAMLNDAVALDESTVAVVGLSGTLLVSRDAGRSFTLAEQADRRGLQAVATAGEGAIVAVGEGGAKRIGLGAAEARP